MRSSATPPPMLLLIFLSAASILPINMFVPAMPRMAEDFDVSYALMNLSVSGFALITAVVHLASGVLSDRYGRRPIVLGALMIFTLASIGCFLAQQIEIFLIFRMMQGVIVAAYAASLAAIRDTSEPALMRRRIGTLTAAWAVAPLIGPTVGGTLSTTFDWRANFLVFSILGAVALALATLLFNETHTRQSGPLNVRQSYGVLLASSSFRAYTVCMAFSLSAFFIFVGTAPRVAEHLGNPSATMVGVLMGLVTAGFMAGSAVVSRLPSSIEPWVLMMLGRGLAVIGLIVALGLLVFGEPHILSFFVPSILIGVGNGFTIPPANARILSLGGSHAGTALGLSSAINIVTAAIFSGLAGLAADTGRPHLWVVLALLAVAFMGFVAAVYISRLETRAEPAQA